MKIKTIARNFDHVNEFDRKVNEALAEGWHLVKREVIPGVSDNSENGRRLLYAELAQLDPVPEVAEPQPMDPLDAVRVIKATRKGVPPKDCHADRCPLSAWCQKMPDGYDPVDWDIPEKEAPRD